MLALDKSAISALGDQVIEQPRDVFVSAEQSAFVDRFTAPARQKQIGHVAFCEQIGAGHVEFMEFDPDFVAVVPRLNFSAPVPIRFADTKWIRMHFRVGGRNTTWFDRERRDIEGALCNLMRLPEGMVSTELHADEQVHWLTVFAKPDFLMREFGLDQVALPAPLRSAFKASADRLVLESAPLPAPAWRLLADLHEDARTSPFAMVRCRSAVTELICLLLESLTNPAEPSARYSPQERERLQRAREMILENLEAPPTIAELARAVGTNRTTLAQNFKDYFGKSIYHTIKTERMGQAVRLLQDGVSVAETARRLGYGGAAAFSYAFKRHFGVAPSQTRAQD